jgi:predicted flap endonuclease-1-like 5' DNA nuclease
MRSRIKALVAAGVAAVGAAGAATWARRRKGEPEGPVPASSTAAKPSAAAKPAAPPKQAAGTSAATKPAATPSVATKPAATSSAAASSAAPPGPKAAAGSPAAAESAAVDDIPPVNPDLASDPPASASAPAASGGTASHDELTAIRGLGKVKAAKLAEAGITSYAQIAAWSDEDIAEIGLRISTSPGQIKREDWVGQARALAKA